jgi:hypothetical protein
MAKSSNVTAKCSNVTYNAVVIENHSILRFISLNNLFRSPLLYPKAEIFKCRYLELSAVQNHVNLLYAL